MAEIQRSFAVIIGINQYLEGIPALKTAVNDATQLAHVLESKYQYQVLQLLDTAATSDKINQILTAFEQQILPLSDGSHIPINKNDRFFFYFAGHGYDRLVKSNPRLAQTIKHVMLRMIVVGGAELSRRRVLCQELEYQEPENTRVKIVIERFVAARLLVKGRDLENNEYIEPAHDALVRGWQKLLNWERQELTSVLLQRELMPIANRWATQRQNKQAVGFLWDNDPRLPLVQQSLQSNSSWLNSVESEFVKHSIQKKRHNRRRTVGVVTGFMTFIIPLQFSPLNLSSILMGGTSPVIGTKPCTYNQSNKKIAAQSLTPNP